jgi:GNAT superfamily N-acetyltransferase
MPVVLSADAVGRRVVIRYRRRDTRPGPPLSDAVGVLVSFGAHQVAVRTGTGTVQVALSDVVASRLVAPDRRSVLDLERIAADGWRAAEVVEYDGWLLRANDGWTSRANSVLPLGTPRNGLDAALAAAQRFYTGRNLPMRIQVPLPARGLLDAELAGRGWTAHTEVLVMTKTLGEPPIGIEPSGTEPNLREAGTLTEDWVAGYHARDGVLNEPARLLLDRHPNRRFVWLTDAGHTVAIARGTAHDGWLGIMALEVAADQRRRGLARTLVAALHRWAIAEGARWSHLEVEAANGPAVALYRSAGYAEHHRYHVRVPPS